MFRILPSLALVVVCEGRGANAASLRRAHGIDGQNIPIQPGVGGAPSSFVIGGTPGVGQNMSKKMAIADASIMGDVPQITSKEFLIISSPSMKKIVYTTLKNFESTYGRTYALIDSGLDRPSGIALDTVRGHLYVADRGVKEIFRYSLYVMHNKGRNENHTYWLRTDDTRLTILTGHIVEWVTVDSAGDVFYSAADTHNINKITAEVMTNLADGLFTASSLSIVTEMAQEALASERMTSETNTVTQLVTDAPPPAQQVLSIYDAAINPHVTVPGGVSTDGLRLYWANTKLGLTNGSVVLGQVNPMPPPTLANGSDPQPFPVTPISHCSDVALGVVKGGPFVFFSTPRSAGGSIFAVPENGGTEIAIVSGLSDPRGLAWDGGDTVYVADEGAGSVFSFPSGRLIEGAPLEKTVDLDGAFGLAVLTEMDEAFVIHSAASPAHSFLLLLASLLPLSFLATTIVT
jgi:sugar lactone lactonase YvrE